MKIRHAVFVAVLAGNIMLQACLKAQRNVETPADAEIIGAREALVPILQLSQGIAPVVRPAALLGIYVNLLLTEGLSPPVRSALDGVDAQIKLHGLPTQENVDDLYSLLEEFGAVLHVDITNMLNRSPDRAKTLDAYDIGLRNITERSKRRADDIKEQIVSFKKTKSEQKRNVTNINKEITNAVKAKDFSTAQDKQKELTDAQTALTTTELTLKEMMFLQKTFSELIDIAEQRVAALAQNREVLIAGLRVVNVPGVEDLGILESKNKLRGGRLAPFGGL